MSLAMFPNGISHYAIGGMVMGIGVALLYATTGRPGGVSTFFSTAWSWVVRTPFFRQTAFLDTRRWRFIYALGLLLGGLLYLYSGLPVALSHIPAWKLALGGLLIGFSARLGGGCTSGHGICGLASLSAGSLVMVCTFLVVAIATNWAFRMAGL